MELMARLDRRVLLVRSVLRAPLATMARLVRKDRRVPLARTEMTAHLARRVPLVLPALRVRKAM
jgi:hypothetical protein